MCMCLLLFVAVCVHDVCPYIWDCVSVCMLYVSSLSCICYVCLRLTMSACLYLCVCVCVCVCMHLCVRLCLNNCCILFNSHF